ncbi:hypothetical protein BA895_14220 [Humibacillus sp. DSM 29435]|uniref:HAMP domain-containing sensor histidine kinase n=1 Tax=Humibacillus sp. DSM 29435 TaxID=1869167 RepID=UPI00087205C6|nr:HAMP domain-containing sensor histidine kinase [Humibacillus sp. DSM 29435]OFE17928.1 hypothetical protein BA895_14220 [Humibacillus sp. DSM 29435]
MKPGSRRTTLAGRITALAVGIAVVTALLAGALVIGLTRSSVDAAAQQTLARLADGAAERADLAATVASQTRAVRTLGTLGVESASIGRGGGVKSTSPLARQALTPARRQELLDGRPVSAQAQLAGTSVLIEGRPTQAGGILLVQRQSDATAASDGLVRRMLLALGIAALVAMVVSALMAARLVRPLRQTAEAALGLAEGRRDLRVPVTGPKEVAEVASALNALTTSLSRSESRQRDFLLSVSHDLRTPLTGIRGYAESLAEGVVPADETSRVGGVMLGEARRLERLVADLLDLARLDTDQPRIEFQRTDLVALGQGVESAWSKRCSDVGVRFRLVRPQSPIWVATDPNRLRQLVDGLLENALRVTPEGQPIIVEVRSEQAGRPVAVIEVRDAGPGLTDDDLSVAFEPSVLHERYRGVRPVGTGLGLAIVGRLGALLGGSVEAGHAAEGGARFTVRLRA